MKLDVGVALKTRIVIDFDADSELWTCTGRGHLGEGYTPEDALRNWRFNLSGKNEAAGLSAAVTRSLL